MKMQKPIIYFCISYRPMIFKMSMITKPHKNLIIITEPQDFPAEAAALLQETCNVIKGPFTGAQLQNEIPSADVLFIRLGHNIDKEILKKGKKLKAVVTATTGLNHIDLDYCHANAIEILSLKGETTFLESISPTADLTFGLILSLLRNIPAAVAHTNAGHWRRDLFKGYDLRGKTLGIYGCGRIGRKVARMGMAFDMKVLAYDKKSQNLDNVEFVDERELLSQSDIVSLHLPYDDTLKYFFGKAHFARMKDKSYFINTARGELVNEVDLLDAIKSNKLAGAALDVLDDEYNSDDGWAKTHPLIQFAAHNKNLIVTPHIGGASYDSMAQVEIFMTKKLLAFLGTA